MKKNEMKKSYISFMSQRKKLLIIPLYHLYHLCIPPYTVGSFHIGPFSTVVYDDMVHRNCTIESVLILMFAYRDKKDIYINFTPIVKVSTQPHTRYFY
jgi:hypothetical protein